MYMSLAHTRTHTHTHSLSRVRGSGSYAVKWYSAMHYYQIRHCRRHFHHEWYSRSIDILLLIYMHHLLVQRYANPRLDLENQWQ